MSEIIFFDGQKAVPISGLPDSAWTWYTPHVSEEAESIKEYHKAVPWLYRGTDLRAKAIGHLPFSIVSASGDVIDSSDDYQNKVGFLPNPANLLSLVEASLTLLGRAYLYRLKNRVKVLGLRYVLAQTIEPVIDEQEGLLGFTRQLSTGRQAWEVDDVVYFWLPDPWAEIGPPDEERCPGMAALVAAGVLHNLGKYASAYFQRGAVRPLVMTVPTRPTPQEETRIKAWLKKVFLGVDNAYTAHIFEKDTEFHTIGDGLGELSESNLTKEQREDISTALGIPMTILWSTEASGLGGGGVVSSDERKFYQQTIIPEAMFIAGTLNEQLFGPLGLRLVFRPETIDVFQEDENQRANAFASYVQAGLPFEIVGQMLGLELPEGYSWEQLAAEREARRQEMAQQLQQKPGPPEEEEEEKEDETEADLKRWEKKALAKGPSAPFESAYIPTEVMVAIRAALDTAQTDEEVKAAFAAPFREAVWSAYP